MELVPIIKLCAILLSILLVITLIVSYILYKIRISKENDSTNNGLDNNFIEPKRVQLKNMTNTVQYVPQPQFVYYTPQKMNYTPKIENPDFKRKENLKANKERFKIINEKTLDIKRMDTNTPVEKAFYYPGNYNSIVNSVNNIDFNSRYSSSENLHKLNFRS